MLFGGPVEVDESYFGGSRKNMSKSKLSTGKTAVVGMKDRRSNRVSAKVVKARTSRRSELAVELTDDHRGYVGLPNHESVDTSKATFM